MFQYFNGLKRLGKEAHLKESAKLKQKKSCTYPRRFIFI